MTREELFRAREERRQRLAELPFDEKVRIMEHLQEMGRTLIAARATLPIQDDEATPPPAADRG
jgi:hypothetical protein